MAFLDRVLDPPAYGYVRNGKFYRPNPRELFSEFFRRLDIFRSRKAWLPLLSWSVVLFLAPFFFLFWIRYFSWSLLAVAFFYSMVFMGTHGTVYLHRFGCHHAFVFKNRFWLFLTRELCLKTVPEEVYVISHHVHHYRSDRPGDPYYAAGGWLYCFLADVNHQALAGNLPREDYARAARLLAHMGVSPNRYEDYLKWGSIGRPLRTIVHFVLNWSFWFGFFWLLGGMALATAVFAGAAVWAVGIRTFNYEGHGRGRDKRKKGKDFDEKSLAINQRWPGWVTGEWHNNHHLYPTSARAGFLPHQWDTAWWWIRFSHRLGGVSFYRDFKPVFEKQYLRSC